MKFLIVPLLLTVIFFSCKQQYNPPVTTSNLNYLVVEGIINTGNDSTFIQLSRTVNLNNKTATKAEAKAVITVEGDDKNSYALKEIKTGRYACAPLNLSKTGKYRLRIITADRKTYLSDFVEVKESPPIDSVGYKIPPTDGLQVYVNTHDPANNTHYYRWEYTETWALQSRFSSGYVVSGKTIVYRDSSYPDIYNCWSTDVSTNIVLGSSEKLTQDVIFNAPVALINSSSEKLSKKYSILVKQYALTQEAFNFWQILKKNTEQLGSIFDAQPSFIKGNIHNIDDAKEPVIGYISAGTVQQKRMFVERSVLPAGWGTDGPNDACKEDTILAKDVDAFFNGGYLITRRPDNAIGAGIVTYMGAPPICVDCTLRGTNKRPAFWQ